MRKVGPIILVIASLIVTLFAVQYYYNILQVPFFWDELGVYSRAAIHQSVHGVSILPSSTPDVLSRGHPLLSTAYFGFVFKYFGVTTESARISAFLIFSLSVLICYLWLAKFGNKWKAAIVSVAVAIQPAFLAQSFIVFPEQMLLLFTLMALYFYKKDNNSLTILSICLSILIKESALVLPIAFGLAHFFRTKNIKLSLAYVFIPILAFVGFLIVQNVQNGYFLYPLHTSLMQFNLDIIWDKLLQNLHFIFIYQGRYWIWLIIIIALFFTFKTKLWDHIKALKPWEHLMFWLVLGGLLFSSINYFLPRYIQYWMFPLMALSIMILCNKVKPIFMYVIVLACISNSIFLNNNQKAFEDTDFSYVQHTKAINKSLIRANELDSTKSFAYNWPIVMSNWVDVDMYPKPNHKVDMLQIERIDSFDYIVLNIPGEPNRTQITKNWAAIDSSEVGYAKVVIFKKREP